MGAPITPTRAPSRAGTPEGNLPFLCKEDFSGFFPEPFSRAIAAAAVTTATATLIITTAAITTTAIGGIRTRVKVFPSGETF